ncbi:hypothetical protein DRO54_10530 [Candidatus Bathyarchaeota archaeon]|nr:MAG: hypothetical protein DRO54_10530 [Candidatus Bathyarchaeota archaeon]
MGRECGIIIGREVEGLLFGSVSNLQGGAPWQGAQKAGIGSLTLAEAGLGRKITESTEGPDVLACVNLDSSRI